LLLGATGAYSARQYIEDQVLMYKSELDQRDVMLELVVPTRPIQRGETIRAEDLAMRQVPERFAESNAIHWQDSDELLGLTTAFEVNENRPLSWAHIAGSAEPTFSSLVADGQRAMAVRVDEINSISGFLQPSDKVDLLLTYGHAKGQKTFPVLSNIEVMATGMQTGIDDGLDSGLRSFTTITVHVSPENAQRITLAQQIGKITAILRNPKDKELKQSKALSVSQLIGDNEEKSTISQKTKTVARLARARIEYIIGGL
ncbi:MAG: Flp pilus assembly protein CpaB, partial [Granulosicoccus sp.]|nr:Flp pilus assembly protein CpaB [Granulosicoccus sp.]